MAAGRTLAVDGCTIHFTEAGPADAPAVVLSHGATLDHASWEAQVAALAGRYRVVSWDMRGHGASRPAGAPIRLERLAADLGALLDHLGINRAALVGLSLGSYVSQEFGYRHPERVAALASLDATSLTGTRLSGFMRWAMSVSHVVLGLYPYPMLVRETARSAALTPAAQAYIERTAGRLSKAEYIAIWAAVQTGLRQEPDYRAPFPLLIAVGDKDKVGVTRRGAIEWGADRSEAAFHLIPEAGHCANLDNPGFVNAMLAGFLDEHLPGRG